MAVQLEFLNILISVQRMESMYPDGLAGYLRDHAKSIGRTIWYDQNLIRAGGAMDPEVMDNLIQKWVRLGFAATEELNGVTVWRDFCAVDAFGFSRHQCPWVVVDGAERIAWMRGAERGEIIGREQYQ